MKLKSERIKELERENANLKKSLDGTRHQLMYHLKGEEEAVRKRDEQIAELEEQVKYFKDEYAKEVWHMADYVSFYERVKALVEEFEEDRDKPKVVTVDLRNQVEPEFLDICSFITNVIDEIVGEENG